MSLKYSESLAGDSERGRERPSSFKNY